MALFFASGSVALLYQVVWVRQFVHVFGATVLAVSTVLAAFMGGLALGGIYGGRVAPRQRDPLRFYAGLELVLALYAGLVPWILRALAPLYAALYAWLQDSFWALSMVRFLVSALVLLPPTFLMGATLPALTEFAQRQGSHVRSRIAQLYAANTFGAVAGTFAASFLLLPGLGVTRTLVAGVALNLVVALSALGLARRSPAAASAPPESTEAATPGARLPLAMVLGTAGVLGFSALAFEILWTRALMLALGGTAYSFAIVLTVFLLGIASGSAAAARLLRGSEVAARRAFVAAPAVIGFAALMLLPAFDRLPAMFVDLSTRGGGTWGEGLLVRFLVAGIPLLVPTFVSGAAFPLAVGLVRGRASASRAVGDVYAANTLGAILGSWAAGFVLIPALGLRGGIVFAASVLIAATTTLLLLTGSRASRRLAPALVAAAVTVILLTPDWDPVSLTRGGFAVTIDLRRLGQRGLAAENQELVFFEEGITTTVSVRRKGDVLSMQMNGVTEASTGGDLETQLFLGGIGTLLHPAPRDVLVIGLGSGISAAAVLRDPGVASLDCVEISEAVVHGARWFDEANDHAMQDPRFRMILGDGRNHVRMTDRRYDLIVSEPSNVWNSGIGSMMASEFFELAAERLRPDGLVVSWIQGYALSPDALRSVLAAARTVFPHTTLWMAGWGDFAVIAGRESFAIDPERIREKGRRPELARTLREIGAPNLPTLLAKNVLAGGHLDRFLGDFPANTDDNLFLEFAAPKLLYRETLPELFGALDAARGGAETLLVNAPSGMLAEVARAQQAATLEDQARLAFRANQGDEGLRAIESARALNPMSPSIANLLGDALNGRGEQALRDGRVPEAAADFVRATEADPSDGTSFANLSRAYAATGEMETALAASDEALRRAPRNADFRADRAALRLRRREFGEAADDARAALALDERHPSAFVTLTTALDELGGSAEADSLWTERLEKHPEDEPLAGRRTRRRTRRGGP